LVPWHNAEGQVGGIIIFNELITEKKRAEDSLRIAHETLLTILDSIDATIYVADMKNHEILFMNKYMKELFRGDLKGKKCWEVFRGEAKPCVHCTNDKLLDEKGNASGVCIWEGLNPITGRWYINYDRAIRWIDGRMVRIQIAMDITEIKTLQEEHAKIESQLHQARKMEAIGTLAGGIAHDFNNLLMGIQGYTSLMLMDMPPGSPNHDRLKSIEQVIERGAELTSKILGYARKGRFENRVMELNPLISETAETIGRTRKNMTLRLNLDKALYPIEADTSQIQQVLFNLFINASDAMPQGGVLAVSTANTTDSSIKSDLFTATPGRYVCLTVSDTGVGIDKNHIDRIFEPFFTTKEMGRGTGLGLASVYGIVKSHGGYIEVMSEKGQGALFTVYLPATDKSPKHPDPSKTPTPSYKGIVLLVDDEPMILQVGKLMLEKLGFSVFCASNGKAAVALYEKHANEVTLVILDMIMPGMSGGETYDTLAGMNKTVKTILSSGYSMDGQAREIMEKGCSGFIQKPFTLEQLSAKIKEVLGH
jgi:signal transduction histidine kinase/CheY-like chemotaxis protein